MLHNLIDLVPTYTAFAQGVGVYAMTMELGVVQFDSNSQDLRIRDCKPL